MFGFYSSFDENNTHTNVFYTNKKMSDLSDMEISSCADLFTNNYGVYSNKYDDEKRRGKSIRLSPSYYKKYYMADGFNISMAFNSENELIGHAIYVVRQLEDTLYASDDNSNRIVWVIQLVVHKNYRKQGIGTRLLNSIWGFSNYAAWGLATANPCTIKVLENATFRRVVPEIIHKNLDKIMSIGRYIAFVSDDMYDVDSSKSVLKSDFFVDHSDTEKNIKAAYGNDWILGDLNEGEEWLGFTFNSQKIDERYLKNFESTVKFSENKLREAYKRMDLSSHKWNKHQNEEIECILSNIELPNNAVIADFGCGTGRHSIELARRGYIVKGIDFEIKNINKAKKNVEGVSYEKNVDFVCADCRKYKNNQKFDLIVCLYDVVGSFPDDKENMKIIQNISENLKSGGWLALSVMNMELTQSMAKYSAETEGDLLYQLFKLKASNVMQKTGNIFDPELYIIDKNKKIVYRKEQFTDDGDLPAELVIRDKCYTMDEITNALKNNGFDVVKKLYVQSGRFDVDLKAVDSRAKEIFVICRKK